MLIVFRTEINVGSQDTFAYTADKVDSNKNLIRTAYRDSLSGQVAEQLSLDLFHFPSEESIEVKLR
jgi:hypothetical protein